MVEQPIMYAEYTRKLNLSKLAKQLYILRRRKQLAEVLRVLQLKHGLNQRELRMYYLFLELYFDPNRKEFDIIFQSRVAIAKKIERKCSEINGEQKKIFLGASSDPLYDLMTVLEKEKKLILELPRTREFILYDGFFEQMGIHKRKKYRDTMQPIGENFTVLYGDQLFFENDDEFYPYKKTKGEHWSKRPVDVVSFSTQQRKLVEGEQLFESVGLYEAKELLYWYFFGDPENDDDPILARKLKRLDDAVFDKNVHSGEIEALCKKLLQHLGLYLYLDEFLHLMLEEKAAHHYMNMKKWSDKPCKIEELEKMKEETYEKHGMHELYGKDIFERYKADNQTYMTRDEQWMLCKFAVITQEQVQNYIDAELKAFARPDNPEDFEMLFPLRLDVIEDGKETKGK